MVWMVKSLGILPFWIDARQSRCLLPLFAFSPFPLSPFPFPPFPLSPRPLLLGALSVNGHHLTSESSAKYGSTENIGLL